MQSITMNSNRFEPVVPSEADVQLAGKTGKRLAVLLNKQDALPIQLLEKGHAEESLELPESAARLLVDLLAEIAKGNPVTLVSVPEEITTQQAAELLNVSRPYFVQMLDNAEIPHRKVGSRRRVKLQDVLTYKHELYNQRQQTLDELTLLDQSLGLQ